MKKLRHRTLLIIFFGLLTSIFAVLTILSALPVGSAATGLWQVTDVSGETPIAVFSQTNFKLSIIFLLATVVFAGMFGYHCCVRYRHLKHSRRHRHHSEH